MTEKMKSKITFGQKTINFSIIRSARRKKTIALSIEPTGYVLVRAPINTPYPRLTQIVKSKAKWIIRRLGSLDNTLPPVKKEFVSGESFPLLGRHVRLKVLQDSDVNKPVVRMHRGRIKVIVNTINDNGKSSIEIKDAITKWYRLQAAKRIPERTKVYSKKMGLEEPKVFIRDQQKRWGSCNSKGILRFNWRIIMAPMSLIDYVVVHEICHLKYMNHSKLFWKYLGMIMPDYEKRERSLKENGIGFQI
jgi:predicted metal-dependent hydrolase